MQHVFRMTPEHPLDWNDIPVLLALARNGSMRAAARRLAIDTSTVSRRLSAVERRLQTQLFLRKPEGYVPTEAGRAFLLAAEQMERGMLALVTATRTETDQVSGRVRITSVDAVLNDWLVPRLPDLLAQHGGLQVEAFPDNEVLSFRRSEADLALRVARPREDAAIAMRKVASVGMAVFGVERFRGVPRKGWAELPWVVFQDDLAQSLEMQWLSRAVPQARWRFRCSSMSTVISACRSGLGVAVLPCLSAHPASGLVRLSEEGEFQRELWLLSHRDARRIQRFRAVADWIAAAARADARRFAGAD